MGKKWVKMGRNRGLEKRAETEKGEGEVGDDGAIRGAAV